MTTDDDATVVDAVNRRPTLGPYELLRPVGRRRAAAGEMPETGSTGGKK